MQQIEPPPEFCSEQIAEFLRIYCHPSISLHFNGMLLQFTVSNFRAFREAQTLNLAARASDKALPENWIERELPGLNGTRWLKGVALYGPNASGKSTMIDALQAFAELVGRSAKVTDPEEPIRQIQPFALGPDKLQEPTAFGATFVSGNVRFEYRVAATRERIWHESLRAFPNTKEQLWYSRDWDEELKIYHWTPEKSVGYKRDSKIVEFTLPNVLFLSKAISLGDTILEPVYKWFRDHLKFEDLSTKRLGMTTLGLITANEISQNTDLSAKIVELLKHADLGIEAVEVRHEKLSSKVADMVKSLMPDQYDNSSISNMSLPKVEFSHKCQGDRPISLPWDSESAGTHRLFALAGPWLNILENGYTVCIDELDTSMHPLMVMALLRLLFSNVTNPKGAQVIFTTHNPLLLDATLIRRDQVWFTDKDEGGEAHLYPLTDFAPRKGESLVRGYLAGRYGAIPFIPEGLLGFFHPADLEEKEDLNER